MNNHTKDRLYSEYKTHDMNFITRDTKRIVRYSGFKDYVVNGGFFSNDISYYRVRSILKTT